MGGIVELPNVHKVVVEANDSALVVVHVTVVGRGKDTNDGGEICRRHFLVQVVAA